MVSSVTNISVSKGGHDYQYADYFGLSTDTKPTTGVMNGSTFLEATDGDSSVTWTIYIFNAADMDWLPFVSWEVSK